MPGQIIVLGMHRSGTSVVMNLLSAAGCYVGEKNELLPATKANPQGFWEHLKVIGLNKNILVSVGLDWISADQFDLRKIPQAAQKNLSEQIKETVKTFNKHEAWAIKDPRFCITLPLWKKHLPKALIIVCIRHPIEIAKSLEKRNGLPLSVGCALWEYYTKTLISNCNGMEHMVISYPALIESPKAETQKLISWLIDRGVPGISQPNAKKLKKIVNPSLYRQHYSDTELSGLLTENQQALFAAFRQGGLPSWDRFEAGSKLSWDIIGLFNINRKLSRKLKDTFSEQGEDAIKGANLTSYQELSFFQFEKMIKENESIISEQLAQQMKIHEKAGRIAQLKEILDKKEDTASQQGAQLQEQKAIIKELNQRIGDSHTTIKEHLRNLKAQATQIDQLKGSAKEKDAALEKRSAEMQEYLGRIEQLEKAATESKAILAEQLNQIRDTRATVKKQLKQIQDQSLKIAELEETVKEKESILEKRSAEMQEYLGRIEQLEKAATESKAILAEQLNQIQEQKASHEKLKETANNRKATIRDMEKTIHDQGHQISQLEKIIKKNEETVSLQTGTINDLKKHIEEVQELASSLETEGKKALGMFVVGGKSFKQLYNKIFNSVLPVRNKMD